MKIALAQINPIIGDLDHNFKLVIENVKKARKDKADLLVLSELALLGYPPKDLLLKPSLLKDHDYFLNELAIYTDDDFGILIGGLSANEGDGKSLFNSLIFLHGGKIAERAHKTLLPNYDVFDETRYFEPSKKTTIVEFKGLKLGLSICEDIWIEAYPSMYLKDPISDLVSKDADVIINAAASPFVTDKPERRQKLLSNVAKRYSCPIVYLNQVGANDQLIFDGASAVFSAEGELVKSLKAFEEDFQIFDMDPLIAEEIVFEPESSVQFESTKLKPSIEEVESSDIVSIKKALVLGIRDYVQKCGFDKVILGVSGGIDSALVAALAVEALGADNVHALFMPSKNTGDESTKLAQALVDGLGIKNYEVVPINDLHDATHKLLPDMSGLAEENLQARLRASILMTKANSLGAMLLNTGNKSELAVGYCTIYGDMCGGLAVISDLLKTTVYRLSNFINEEAAKELIPQGIIDRAPTAELRPGQKDQDSLPPYDVLDKLVVLYIQESKSLEEIVEMGYEKELAVKVLNMIDRSEYKRHQAPPGLKVAGKAFGTGRRMPIAQGYKHSK